MCGWATWSRVGWPHQQGAGKDGRGVGASQAKPAGTNLSCWTRGPGVRLQVRFSCSQRRMPSLPAPHHWEACAARQPCAPGTAGAHLKAPHQPGAQLNGGTEARAHLACFIRHLAILLRHNGDVRGCSRDRRHAPALALEMPCTQGGAQPSLMPRPLALHAQPTAATFPCAAHQAEKKCLQQAATHPHLARPPEQSGYACSSQQQHQQLPLASRPHRCEPGRRR